MSNIYLTSDSHFFHSKSFIYEARGYNSIEEMNESFVDKWNSIVKDDDIVYHLGDVFLNAEIEEGIALLKRLKGQKHLIIGNHDTTNRISAFLKEGIFEDANYGGLLKMGKKTFNLSHYPQLVSNGTDKKPIYSLHGHTHQTSAFSDIPNAYNVGVDAHDGFPVSIESIVKTIKGE